MAICEIEMSNGVDIPRNARIMLCYALDVSQRSPAIAVIGSSRGAIVRLLTAQELVAGLALPLCRTQYAPWAIPIVTITIR